MKQKTHKALAKRVKITKGGKILKRYCGQDHFNSRDGGKISRKKRRDTELTGRFKINIKQLLPNG